MELPFFQLPRKPLNVLIGCEHSQVVAEQFHKRGHKVLTCDFLPAEKGLPHYQGDVFDIINNGFDLGIFHPPCTFLCSSGLHWNGRVPGRQQKTDEAVNFVKKLWAADIPGLVLENPIGCLSTRFMKPSQIIQPYEFGEDASKATCLWVRGLPLLQKTKYIEPRIVNGKKRWANQTDSGQNRLAPSPDRWKERSKTYEGIAAAMAEQWAGNVLNVVR